MQDLITPPAYLIVEAINSEEKLARAKRQASVGEPLGDCGIVYVDTLTQFFDFTDHVRAKMHGEPPLAMQSERSRAKKEALDRAIEAKNSNNMAWEGIVGIAKSRPISEREKSLFRVVRVAGDMVEDDRLAYMGVAENDDGTVYTMPEGFDERQTMDAAMRRYGKVDPRSEEDTTAIPVFWCFCMNLPKGYVVDIGNGQGYGDRRGAILKKPAEPGGYPVTVQKVLSNFDAAMIAWDHKHRHGTKPQFSEDDKMRQRAALADQYLSIQECDTCGAAKIAGSKCGECAQTN